MYIYIYIEREREREIYIIKTRGPGDLYCWNPSPPSDGQVSATSAAKSCPKSCHSSCPLFLSRIRQTGTARDRQAHKFKQARTQTQPQRDIRELSTEP